jgi:hypothetical protein
LQLKFDNIKNQGIQKYGQVKGMFEFILKHLKEILLITGGVVLATIFGRYKKAIADGTNFVIDSILSCVRLRRTKKANT